MNRSDSKKIADTITFDQLKDMLERAKSEIKDWEEVSAVNKQMTKGMAWNILSKGLEPSMRHRALGVKNMIWEFGDYLDEDLKIKKKKKDKSTSKPCHQEPIF